MLKTLILIYEWHFTHMLSVMVKLLDVLYLSLQLDDSCDMVITQADRNYTLRGHRSRTGGYNDTAVLFIHLVVMELSLLISYLDMKDNISSFYQYLYYEHDMYICAYIHYTTLSQINHYNLHVLVVWSLARLFLRFLEKDPWTLVNRNKNASIDNFGFRMEI